MNRSNWRNPGVAAAGLALAVAVAAFSNRARAGAGAGGSKAGPRLRGGPRLAEAAEQLGDGPRRIGRRGPPRSRLPAAPAEHDAGGSSGRTAAPPVLEFDASGTVREGVGRARDGLRLARQRARHRRRLQGHVWIGGSAPVAPSLRDARRRHAAEVRQQGEVPAADRRPERQQGQRRHEDRAPVGRRVRVAQDERGVRRRRLRQPPRDRVRRRHRRVQAPVGRVRQHAASMRRAIAGPRAARPSDAARRRRSTPRARDRRSSADRSTASRCRTTAWSTWPTVPTAVSRCSRRKASTSRRCSSTAPARRTGRQPAWRSRPTRSSSSSTSPTTATRTSPCSTARACRCCISSAAQRQARRLPGHPSPRGRLEGQHLHRRSRAGRARAAVRLQGAVEHAAAERAHARAAGTRPLRRHRPLLLNGPGGGARTYPPPGQARGGYPALDQRHGQPVSRDAGLAAAGRHQAGRGHRHHSRRQGRHLAAPPVGAADPPHRPRRATWIAASATACSCRPTASARTATATSGRATAGRSPTTRPPKAAASSCSSSAPRARCCCRSARPACRRPASRRRSSVRRRARLRPTATSSWPTGTGRVRPTRSRTAIGWCGSRPTARSWPSYGKMGGGPGEFMGPHALAFDSQGRLFVADRSNNRVQVFDRNMQFVDEWRHFGRPSGIAILKDDTIIVADSGVEPVHRRPARGARGRRQRDAQPRVGQRHPHRQREGRLAALLRAGHAARRHGRRRTRATCLPG